MNDGFARWLLAFAIAGVSVRIVDSFAPGFGYWAAFAILLGVFLLRDRGQFRTFVSIALGR